jgi:lipopolysaccharide export system ATP-binding protein
MSQQRTEHKLAAQGLVRSFKKRTVVNQVGFTVESGKVIGLLGPNGAGKTTSFYMVVGLLYPDQGNVFLDGENITSLPMHIRARKGISYLPQNTSIFRRMTVEENLLSVMEVVGLPQTKTKAYLKDLLDKFQIGHIRSIKGAALSGGERRRVEIARSLIIQPKFLLLDEPFAGIDPVTVQEIQGIIKGLRDDGIGILITDHNVRETLGSCDSVYILSQGQVIASGLPDEVASNPLVRENYLGQNFKV